MRKKIFCEKDFGNICSSERMARLFDPIRSEWQEHFCLAVLNTANEPLGVEVLTVGLEDRTQVTPSVIFKTIFTQKKYLTATAIAVCHNHPSGTLLPSNEDLQLTRRIVAAAKMFGMTMVDHIVVSIKGFTSIRHDHPDMF